MRAHRIASGARNYYTCNLRDLNWPRFDSELLPTRDSSALGTSHGPRERSARRRSRTLLSSTLPSARRRPPARSLAHAAAGRRILLSHQCHSQSLHSPLPLPVPVPVRSESTCCCTLIIHYPTSASVSSHRIHPIAFPPLPFLLQPIACLCTPRVVLYGVRHAHANTRSRSSCAARTSAAAAALLVARCQSAEATRTCTAIVRFSTFTTCTVLRSRRLCAPPIECHAAPLHRRLPNLLNFYANQN